MKVQAIFNYPNDTRLTIEGDDAVARQLIDRLDGLVIKYSSSATTLGVQQYKMRSITSDQQTLIDIMFSVAMTLRSSETLKEMSNDQLGAWVAKQLRDCGFDTKPTGSSWGVLVNNLRKMG